MRGNFWTEPELQTLRDMIDQPLATLAAAIPNRSKKSIRRQRLFINMTPEQSARYKAKRQAEDARRYQKMKDIIASLKYEPIPSSSTPTPEMMRARDVRLATPPRDLTAALCGDPLPGYSALDRRGAL